MFPIILVGDRKEIALGQQLTAALSKSGNVLHVTGCRIFSKSGKADDYVIAEADLSCNITLSKGVVVLKESAKDTDITGLGSVPIISPSNNNPSYITCGTGDSDTFSLSSYFDGCASVSLQKTLVCPINSEIIEPREIPVRLCAQYDRYVLLCAVAVLLLSGNDIDTLQL